PDGNLYVTDTENHTVRRITPDGTVSTMAGSPGASGSVDGTNDQARFYRPRGITVDRSGNLFVADEGNEFIRKITPVGTNWVVRTIAKTVCNFGIAADSAGTLYVASGNSIRELIPMGNNWVGITIAGR